MDRIDIALTPVESYASRITSGMNPLTTVILTDRGDRLNVEAAIDDGWGSSEAVGAASAHPRVAETFGLIQELYSTWSTVAGPVARSTEPVFLQCIDEAIDVPSVSWQASEGDRHIRLIPDLYYFAANGYEQFAPHLFPWSERADVVGWRGSTTGRALLTVEDLDDLPRYWLAKAAAQLGTIADVGFSSVVQAIDPSAGVMIHARLNAEGLLKPFRPFETFGTYRYIVDVAGNASAWNFMEKLRLGSCMLRVESKWRQWYDSRLVPWQHYVPIDASLLDFGEKLAWCRSHPDIAAEIAAEGQAFAVDMRYEDELRRAAMLVFARP